MKIAVVGAGVSGLVAARILDTQHDVTVFEAAEYAGGHTNTVSVTVEGQSFAIDTGFIVYNERTYPAFCGLLESLNVATQPTTMGFAVRCDRCGLEYSGSSVAGLFARRRNLVSPIFYRMLADILRFNRRRDFDLNSVDRDLTVGQFLQREGFSAGFAEHYLLPMGAAIWSCPMETFEAFPMRFILEFYRNHGLMQVFDRPVWRVIQGGSQKYVAQLIAPFLDRIRLKTPVERVERGPDGVRVWSRGEAAEFDEVVFACHSDQALRMLAQPDRVETWLLQAFPYSKNVAHLHTDVSVLPRRETTWSSWNYRIPAERGARPSVTYYMNLLQGIDAPVPFCVSLNEEHAIDPSRILGTYHYSHPVFTVDRAGAQAQYPDMIRRDRISYCGAYWGNGFHEDGVQSGLAVAAAFGIVPDWAPRGTISTTSLVPSAPEVSHVR